MLKNVINFPATGTSWKIDLDEKISSGEVSKIESLIKKKVNDFENTYSRFIEDSLVSQMSVKKGKFFLPEDARPLFDFYFELNELSEGKFTPLSGEILSQAGYDKNYSFIQKTELSNLPKLKEALFYDFPNIEVKIPRGLDFGAAGKGYLIDIVGEILEQLRIDYFCIDAGGDILYKSDKNIPLEVGLENPLDTNQVIGVAAVKNKSICGSSGNRRKWDKFNHIINPDTYLSPTEILATWAVADITMEADGLATCLFFTDPKALKEHFDFEYLILRNDFSVDKSDYFPAKLFRA